MDPAALEDARDGDDPKAEIIALIKAKMTMMADAPVTPDLDAMTVKELRGTLYAIQRASTD
eukprot:COSAG01_NODE_8086_length_2925_cov_12.218684_3_plen_61_part_00